MARGLRSFCHPELVEGRQKRFTTEGGFTFGMNMILGFVVDEQGERAMVAQPFPKDVNTLECTIPRGSIENMTVQQTGEMTPEKMITGTARNIQNIKDGKPGQPVDEGITPYCV